MEFLKKVKETITKYSMLKEGDSVLIGLSGGPDSVCLGVILHELRVDFNLALNAVYIDHGMRPLEAENEKKFCKEFCNRLGIGFYAESVNVKKYAKDKRLNLQETARELRYHAYDEVSAKTGATKIALGHTADDQAETVLMMLVRGSGSRGLCGIPPVRGKIVRPLIGTERKAIEDFLTYHSSLVTPPLSPLFILDSSNVRRDYFRNFLRLEIMPQLRKKNPSLIKGICRATDILRDEDAYLEFAVTKKLMRLISRKSGHTVELFLVPLETMEKPILRRVLRRAVSETETLRGIDFIHIEDMIELIKKGKAGDSINLPRGIRVIKSYSTLKLTSEAPLAIEPRTLSVPGEVVLEDAGIMLKAFFTDGQEDYGDGKSAAVFDADKVTIPLGVRARKRGDFFYPSGFGKKKKLQDFFVDEKIPRDERDSIPLVVSQNDIIWVAGYRSDERFKAMRGTQRLLKLIISKCRDQGGCFD